MQAPGSEEGPWKPTKSLASAIQAVAAALQVDLAWLRSPDRSWTVSRQRTLAAYVLVRRKGYGVGEVAAYLGRDVTTLSALLSRFAGSLRREPELGKRVERVAKSV
jgi:chromosomal replication initiation ATPase DnaA